MKILFRAYRYFHQKKNFRKKLAENLLGSGSGSGCFRKSDPDPVKNRPDPQHCLILLDTGTGVIYLNKKQCIL
jgi:hypothetical protein